MEAIAILGVALAYAGASIAALVALLIALYAAFDHFPIPRARDVINVADACYEAAPDDGHHASGVPSGDGAVPTLRVLSWNTWCIPVYGTGNPTDGGPGPGLWARLTRPFGRAGFLTRVLAPPLLDKKPHGRAVAAFLKRRIRAMARAPDVLLLQEVWGAPTANAWQEACLSRKAVLDALREDYPYYTGSVGCGTNPYRPVLDIPPLDSGLLVMSKHPIRAADVHFERFACVRGNECFVGKGVLAVRVAPPGMRPALLATTHLQANEPGAGAEDDKKVAAVQVQQTRQLAAMLERLRWADAIATGGIGARGTTPVVVAGDFNTVNRRALIRIRSAMRSSAMTHYGNGELFSAFAPGEVTTTNERPGSGFPQAQLDAVFSSGGLRPVRAVVVEDRPNRVDDDNPSDHKPLMVDFEERW